MKTVLGDQRVAAGAPHAGCEPGVLDGQVRHRDQGQPGVGWCPAIAGHRDSDHGPVGVQRIGRPCPLAGHDLTAVGALYVPARGEHAGHFRVGVASPDILLGALGVQRGEPVAHVDEADRPAGRTATAGKLGGDPDLRLQADLVPAEAPRDGYP